MTDVWPLYDRHARAFDADRGRELVERAYLDAVVDGLADGAPVLDVGCGAGEPIAGYLIERGFSLTGVDAAAAMIVICQERWPDGDWTVADMRTLDLGRGGDRRDVRRAPAPRQPGPRRLPRAVHRGRHIVWLATMAA